jgi:apolipoprotein D and lipocalin family protein
MHRWTARAAMMAALAVSACDDKPPLTVAEVDLGRFQGKWYEIAKLPRRTETGCEGTTATYRLKPDGKLDLQSECKVGGVTQRMIAEAVVSDPQTPGKLSLDIGGFFGDYWILEVGKDYEYAVVGHPTRSYLWILSRTPTLPRDDLTRILDGARERQFDVSRLEYTVQTGESNPADPAPAEIEPRQYGCAIASGGSGRAGPWLAPSVLLASLLRRRRRASQAPSSDFGS